MHQNPQYLLSKNFLFLLSNLNQLKAQQKLQLACRMLEVLLHWARDDHQLEVMIEVVFRSENHLNAQLMRTSGKTQSNLSIKLLSPLKWLTCSTICQASEFNCDKLALLQTPWNKMQSRLNLEEMHSKHWNWWVRLTSRSWKWGA